jgi:hypothetical protein
MGAARITQFISDEMHDRLVTHIMNTDYPISVILDSATDSKQNHYMVVLLHTLEDNKPHTYFYRLLQVGSDESARALMHIIQTAWQAEPGNFLDAIRTRLVGYVSDGANVMSGKRNGLYAHMNRFAEKELYPVHCFAHKTNLIGRHSISNHDETEEFECTVNDCSAYYNRVGHKKSAHLRETATQLQETLLHVNYIYTSRWIASEVRAVNNLRRSWKVITTDLKEISQSNDFSATAIRKAGDLYERLTKPSFLFMMNFLLDTFSELKHFSEELQQRHGLLIGKDELIRNTISLLELLKENDGVYLSRFTEELICSNSTINDQNPDKERPCTEETLYASEYSVWQGMPLNMEFDEQPVKISSFREGFLETLITGIEEYFPEGELEIFSALEPQQISLNFNSLDEFGNDWIGQLAQRFDVNETEALMGWTQLKADLKEDQDWCTMKGANPRDFWAYYLSKDGLELDESFRTLVKIVLSIPIGSSEAERSFSIMSHIKTRRRMSMGVRSLEAIMRIRINMPDELERFAVTQYVRKWLDAKHLRSDDILPPDKKRNFDGQYKENLHVPKKKIDESTLF